VRKTTKGGGGGLNCVFKNFSFLRSEKLFPDSESEIVQSLTEFRVLVQRIIVREQREKEHKQLYRFLLPLALPRRVPLKCNVGLQVAQSHKKETYQCSRTTPRDFYAQSHKKETYQYSRTTPRDFYAQSHKKETYQCSRTTPRDFYAQSHKKETSMLKDNSKRLPLLNHNWKRLLYSRTTPRDFLCSITTERDFS